MKTIFALAVVLLLSTRSPAEIQAPVPLWPDGAPGALGSTSNDIPTLTPYLPDSTNATRRGDGDLSGRRLQRISHRMRAMITRCG